MAPPGGGEMDPDDVEEIRRYSPSGTSKTLRACLRCRQIMNKDQFMEYGCPNCQGSLAMQGSEGRVLACTTANFQGFMTLIRPGPFASRFTGLENRRPGCYALTVKGTLPDHVLHESDAEGSEIEAAPRSVQRAAATPTGSMARPTPPAAPAATTPDGTPGARSPPLGKEDSSEDEALAQPGSAAAAAAPPSSAAATAGSTPQPGSAAATAGTPQAGGTSVGSTPQTGGTPVGSTSQAGGTPVGSTPQAGGTPVGSTPQAGGEASQAGGTPAGEGGSTPKRRRLDVQAGEQSLILEPEGDAEFGGDGP